MKKHSCILVLFLIIGGFFIYPGQLNAETVDPSYLDIVEVVEDFDVRIALEQDGSFQVTETIIYDFGEYAYNKHGIYREIPYAYERNQANYNVRITVLSAKDLAGNEYPYQITKTGGYLQIKIGDADITVTGKKSYVITYRVERAINFFDTHDELYWNVTGDQWIVDIASSTASVSLPQGVLLEDMQLACFTGYYSSEESDCQYQIVDERHYAFYAEDTVYAGGDFTILLGLPKGVVIEPSTWQNLRWFLQDNWYILLPLIVFFFLFFRWWTKGRDPETKYSETIVPHYGPPQGMPPGVMGVVYDEKADLHDISSSLIDFAVRGFIKIRPIEGKGILKTKKDYEFIRLKDAKELEEEYEKLVFKAIFNNQKTKRLSNLKNKFYKELPKIKEALYKSVVEQQFFPLNPDKVRSSYFGWGIVFIIIGIFMMGSGLAVLPGIAVMVSGVLVTLFANAMPRKTNHGANTHAKILGLKMYLTVA
ncbi:DUF2207 domain-containing protein, partial [Patescibacteria group bacterium]|nr:DUF2207 domain-containing protein [Patescibacteria group bacterium]